MLRQQSIPCPLCAELNASPDSLMAQNLPDGLNNLAFKLSDDLAVVPSLGGLTPQHNLITTRRHSTGLLSAADGPMYNHLIEHLRNVQRRTSGGVMIAFEHGSRYPIKNPICSTEHAHVHYLEMREDSARRVLAKFGGNQRVYSDAKIFELAPTLDDVYLAVLVLEHFGEVLISHRAAQGAPSQFLRQIVAHELRIDWDWRRNPTRWVPNWIQAQDWLKNVKLGPESNAA